MKSKNKPASKIILRAAAVIILLTVLTCLILYLKKTNDYQTAVHNLSYNNIDISHIHDGIYTGECDVNFIYAKVDVTIDDGRITNIDLVKHENDRGSSAEVITDTIIKEQQIDVDTISGATNSCKVIKKAVENALTAAPSTAD